MIRQIYNYYITPYMRNKGQNLMEYALLLAIIIGIGYFIYSQSGLQQNIKEIFSEATYWSGKMMPATRYFN